MSMSKAAITRLFLAGVAAAAIGALVVLVAVASALASGLLVLGGPAVVALNGSVAWSLVAPLLIGSVAIGAGAIAGVISWVGALLNTVRLEDRTWFAALLVLGLCSFGWLAMVAYVLAGPDGTSRAAGRASTGTGVVA